MQFVRGGEPLRRIGFIQVLDLPPPLLRSDADVERVADRPVQATVRDIARRSEYGQKAYGENREGSKADGELAVALLRVARRPPAPEGEPQPEQHEAIH